MPDDVQPIAEAEPFVTLSLSIWNGLRLATREAGWIAEGLGGVSREDQARANAERPRLRREQGRVMENLTLYLAKELSINPPSPEDLAASAALTGRLAAMTNVNVTISAVLSAATELLNIYNRTDIPPAQA